jgi:hypothetical protein
MKGKYRGWLSKLPVVSTLSFLLCEEQPQRPSLSSQRELYLQMKGYKSKDLPAGSDLETMCKAYLEGQFVNILL